MRKGIIALVIVLILVIAAPFAWAAVQNDNNWGMMGGSMGPMMSQMMDFDSPEFKQHIDQMKKFHDANGISCPGIDQMSSYQNDKSI